MKTNKFKFETSWGFLSPCLVADAESIIVRPPTRIESEEISEQSVSFAPFDHLLYVLFGHNLLSIKVSFEKVPQMTIKKSRKI